MAERVVVLMSVYAREEPEHLDACLISITDQTRPADRIVLVQDGPLDEHLTEVIQRHKARLGGHLVRVPLPRNLGLARALNEGLRYCDGDYVVRMDTDDLAPSDRIAKQLQFMEEHPEIGVLGCAMLEFEDTPDNLVRVKPVESEHEAIAAAFPWRNPINHATCCYRTALVREAGGYPDLRFLEDYYLWAILLDRGVRFHNLTEPLYLCRFDRGTLARRGGWINFRNECYLRWFLYRKGKSSFTRLLLGCGMQFVLRFAPLSVRERLWSATRRTVE